MRARLQFIEQGKYSPTVDWASDVLQQDPFIVSASSLTDRFFDPASFWKMSL